MKALTLLLAVAAAGAVGTGVRSSGAAPACAPIAPATLPTPVRRSPPLVRPGARELTLCRYRGLNPPSAAHRLERARRILVRPEIARLTAELDALPAPRAVFHCPLDDGSEIVATFAYPEAPPEVVRVGLTGCRVVATGRLRRSAIGRAGDRLIAQLTALVP